MRYFIICLAVLVGLPAWTSPAAAQQTSINISGLDFYCIASDGRAVNIYTDPNAARAAASLGGARVDYHPVRGYSMALNLQMLSSAPPRSALLVFMHECGHAALPLGVGLGTPRQEFNADCYAIKWMRDNRFIRNQREFDEAVAYVRQIGGMNGFTGQRVRAMWDCLNSRP